MLSELMRPSMPVTGSPARTAAACAPLKPLPEPVDLEQYPRTKTDPRRWPDQRISPGRMTWTRFSALTGARPAGVALSLQGGRLQSLGWRARLESRI
jgi:hypothetical protein